MIETQQARMEEVLEKVKSNRPTADEAEAYEGLKVVDLFNGVTAGALAKFNVITELFETVSNLPPDTPEDLIKFAAAQLEEITRKQINGLCDCLLVVVACKDEDELEEAC